MSAMSAALIKLLAAKGLSLNDIVEVIEQVEADTRRVRDRSAFDGDEQAERRRAWDRNRAAARRAECDPETWVLLRAAVFKRDDYRCVYCGSSWDLHCDHVMPWSHGGKTELSNLATACARCNISKGARTPEEWVNRPAIRL